MLKRGGAKSKEEKCDKDLKLKPEEHPEGSAVDDMKVKLSAERKREEKAANLTCF